MDSKSNVNRILDDKRRFDEVDYPGFCDRMIAWICGKAGIGYFQLLRAYAFFVLPWIRFKKALARIQRRGFR